jgi:hypothetical protein
MQLKVIDPGGGEGVCLHPASRRQASVVVNPQYYYLKFLARTVQISQHLPCLRMKKTDLDF